jgi:tRNA(Ile2) C34 agmatinyltransferase TiaS
MIDSGDEIYPDEITSGEDAPLTCWCPACGAYLFCLGETVGLECDQCGERFDL